MNLFFFHAEDEPQGLYLLVKGSTIETHPISNQQNFMKYLLGTSCCSSKLNEIRYFILLLEDL